MLIVKVKGNGKGKALDTCYSAIYSSQTHEQQRFTVLEMAADWRELMVLCSYPLSVIRDSWTLGAASRHTII